MARRRSYPSLAALLQDQLEHLEQTDRGHEQTRHVFDGRREDAGVRPVGEVLEPGGRVDDVHTRSGSRGTSVSIPRRKPRIFAIFLTGMISIRFSWRKTCT